MTWEELPPHQSFYAPPYNVVEDRKGLLVEGLSFKVLKVCVHSYCGEYYLT